MRINRPIFYNQHYYFDKQELGEDVKPILNSKKDDIENKNKKDELFDLYRAGQLERLCGIQPTEKEWMPALDAIGRCFEFTTEVSINLTNYCSVNGVYIGCPHNPDIQIEPAAISQPNAINAFKVIPFCLNLDAIQKEKVIFDISYSIYGTVSQNLIPSLEFYSKEKPIQQYSSSEASIVDLSQIGQRTISFEIPAMDIFTQNEGYYILKLGTFDFVKIEFPRCGLPIDEGIYSLAELRDFCIKLNGSPTDEMISFYELLKNGIITQWLQDDDEEGEYKEKISTYIDKILKKRQFKINDINPVLTIICNRTVTFPVSEYFTVTISKIASQNIIGKQNANDKKYYFIPWDSTICGTLTAIIQPKNECIGLDIDFTFKFRTESMSLMDNVFHFNLRDIEQRKELELVFRICVPRSQNMGEFNVYLIDNQGDKQETNTYIIVTGEKIRIPLSNDTAITMVGIYSLKTSPFYLAQTTLSQKHVKVLIEIAEKKRLECSDLYSAYNKSVSHDGANDNLPCAYMNYWGAWSEIERILNELEKEKNYQFKTPNIEELEVALYDGLSKSVPFRPNNAMKKIHPISLDEPIHSTRLSIHDLLGNILSISNSTVRLSYLAFGTTYQEPLQDVLKIRESKIDSCFVGYRPMMVKKINKNKVKEECSNSTISTSYDGDIIQPIDFATFL